MKNTLNKLAVKDVMDAAPLVLTKDQDIYQALALLTDHDVNAAPIVNQTQQLIGFISQQDILRLLWSEEYSAELSYQVHHAMQTEIITVDEAQPISALLEFIVVDKEKLFPVSDNGILTSRSYQSYDERLKAASSNRPTMYPVLKDGKLCGIITSKQLAYLVMKTYNSKSETETEPKTDTQAA